MSFYDVDLNTKLKGKECDDIWNTILTLLANKFNEANSAQPPIEIKNEIVEAWCLEIAKGLNLCFYRNDDWLCFCDKEMAPN